MASAGGGLGGMSGLGGEAENPRVSEMRDRIRKRLAEQEEKERKTKAETVQKAAGYLEQYYEVRRSCLRIAAGPGVMPHGPCLCSFGCLRTPATCLRCHQ